MIKTMHRLTRCCSLFGKKYIIEEWGGGSEQKKAIIELHTLHEYMNE